MRRVQIGLLTAAAAFAAGTSVGLAGDPIRPVSFPTLVDSPDVSTYVHPIVIYHKLPDQVNTTLGKVPVGGDLEVYALAAEIALGKDLSVIAVKDGYIDFNPDDTLVAESGWADLAAGLKYVFLRQEGLVASAKLVAELPTGNDDVWQGNGDGTLDPAVAASKQIGNLQLNGTVGFIQPISDDETSSFYNSWHVSYNIADRLFPLVELNHMHVTKSGNGAKAFDAQADGAVPAIALFDGNDLVNLGASNGDVNPDYVTLALGARVRLCDYADLGAAYEFPLTDEENSLTDSRITADLVVKF